MKKYQRLAEQIRDQIASGVWQPGDRLPSLREQVVSSGMSFMTVGHAYQLLESQGRIIARPQSGYYVAARPERELAAPQVQVMRDEAVDINTYIFDMLQASRDASVMPFASAFPDPRLFPLQQLNRSLAQVSKTATAMSVIENLPPGNAELRHAIARRYAAEHHTRYEELDLIVCHLGGGISVGVHHHGKAVDVNNALDGEGPFSPERAGTLPAGQLIDLCCSGRYTKDELKKRISGRAGLTAHLGTTDVPAIVRRIEEGDKHAGLVLDAMIYQIAKSIGAASVVLYGKIDAILLTGGMAHSDYIISRLKERISFLAPVHVYPGEDEMEALALNALGALRGELPIQEYK